MTTKGWDARSWDRKHRHHRPSRLGESSRYGRSLLTIGLVGLLSLTAGTAAFVQVATQASATSDRVGICHATGSSEEPHVFLIVDRNGAEFAHHLAHSGDFIDVASEDECAPAATSVAAAGEDTTAEHEHACPFEAPVVEPQEEVPIEDTPQTSEADGATQDEVAEFVPVSSDSEEACAADVGLEQTGAIAGNRVVYTHTVTSRGPDEANDVHLAVVLPDTGRSWRLSGPDAAHCTLLQRQLSCDFADLIVGETRNVGASALHCSYDCGEDLAASGRVSAFNDENPANDAAATTLDIPACPEATSAPAGDGTLQAAPPEPAPEEPAVEAPPTEEVANETVPDEAPTPEVDVEANESAPADEAEPEEATASNETAADAAPPPTADVRVGAVTTQDDVEVIFTIRLSSLGPATATGVTLEDALPDVRRPWLLTGPDADACTLDGRELACWFGDLEAGAHRTITLKAFTDRLACGHHLSNTVAVVADNDVQAANNRSTTGIEAHPC